MLSAIAVRKARQKQQQQQIQQDVVVESTQDFADQGDIIMLPADDDEEENEQESIIIPAVAAAAADSSSEDEQEIALPVKERENEGIVAPDALTDFELVMGKNVFALSDEEYTSKSSVLIFAPAQSTLCLIGTYQLHVLTGQVDFYGARLSNEKSHRVYSPRSSPIPAIFTTSNTISKNKIPSRLHQFAPKQGSAIVISDLASGIEGLQAICRTFENVFRLPKWSQSAAASNLGLSGVFSVDRPSKEVQQLHIPASWATTASERVNLIQGPKKVGKSTFARLTVNRLLQEHPTVAYLDLDIGQTEFTPPGFVSLALVSEPIFGPPWTHPSIPHRSHYIGVTHPLNSPRTYLECIAALMEAYRSEFSDVPLVINTMGWIKGLGADILSQIHSICNPDQVYSFEKDPNAIHLDPIASTPNSSSSSARDMSLMSYFFARFEDNQATTWSTALPLRAQRPYEITISQAFDRIVLSGNDADQVVPSELKTVLNGALVAFVEDSASADEEQLYEQGSTVPSPITSNALGLGLIRAIDDRMETLQLLTPLPPARLASCRVLVKGEIELPIWGFLDHRLDLNNPEQQQAPFLHWNTGSDTIAGSQKRHFRRNILRKSQI